MAIRLEAIAFIRLEAMASRLEAIAGKLEAMASRLEAIANRLEAIAGRLEAIASRVEAITSRLEAMAIRLEAIAFLRLEAMAIRLEAIAFIRLEAIAIILLEAIPIILLEAIAIIRLEAIACSSMEAIPIGLEAIAIRFKENGISGALSDFSVLQSEAKTGPVSFRCRRTRIPPRRGSHLPRHPAHPGHPDAAGRSDVHVAVFGPFGPCFGGCFRVEVFRCTCAPKVGASKKSFWKRILLSNLQL